MADGKFYVIHGGTRGRTRRTFDSGNESEAANGKRDGQTGKTRGLNHFAGATANKMTNPFRGPFVTSDDARVERRKTFPRMDEEETRDVPGIRMNLPLCLLSPV